MKKKRGRIFQAFMKILFVFAIVSFWYGAWGFMDWYLLPENESLSYLISMLFGIFVLSYTGSFLEAFV